MVATGGAPGLSGSGVTGAPGRFFCGKAAEGPSSHRPATRQELGTSQACRGIELGPGWATRSAANMPPDPERDWVCPRLQSRTAVPPCRADQARDTLLTVSCDPALPQTPEGSLPCDSLVRKSGSAPASAGETPAAPPTAGAATHPPPVPNAPTPPPCPHRSAATVPRPLRAPSPKQAPLRQAPRDPGSGERRGRAPGSRRSRRPGSGSTGS
jgi:hypothetical protein